ncbi:WD repeat-containing protein 87 [Physocladia obscura]|uniref:WD repeat-containing protein 87 n=1 Tax=Physocladia obscura TaxID=109957 RepID=A0AAD5XGH8_9FUNG|nr:WD repeat-containing protein 87 [Physocladia obscura]
MLSSLGEISVYTTKTNPAKIVDLWETQGDLIAKFSKYIEIIKYSAGYEKVVCMCSLKKKSVGADGLISEEVHALLGGTEAGQIILLPINIIKVISLGSDGIIKIWKMEINSMPSLQQNKVVGSQRTAAPVALTTLASINLPQISGIIVGFSFNPYSSILAIFSDHYAISMYCVQSASILDIPHHSPDEDHVKYVTNIVNLEYLNIFASSSIDGIVKIWDGYHNTQEIQFGSAVLSLCFCNKRGDLLVGISDQVVLLKLQDYFPIYILQELLFKRDIFLADDIEEIPTTFDDDLDFWQLYRDNLTKSGKDLSDWHLLDAENTYIQKLSSEQTEILTQLEMVRQKRIEDYGSTKDREDQWEDFLKKKKEMELIVLGRASKNQSANRPFRNSSVPKNHQIGNDGTDSQEESQNQKDMGDTIEDNDSLDEQCFKGRISTFQNYQERQGRKVQQALDNDSYKIQKLEKKDLRKKPVNSFESNNLPLKESKYSKTHPKFQSTEKKHTKNSFSIVSENKSVNESSFDSLEELMPDSSQNFNVQQINSSKDLDLCSTAITQAPIKKISSDSNLEELTTIKPLISSIKQAEHVGMDSRKIIHPLAAFKRSTKLKRKYHGGSVLPNSVAVAQTSQEQAQDFATVKNEKLDEQYDSISPIHLSKGKNLSLPSYLRSRRNNLKADGINDIRKTNDYVDLQDETEQEPVSILQNYPSAEKSSQNTVLSTLTASPTMILIKKPEKDLPSKLHEHVKVSNIEQLGEKAIEVQNPLKTPEISNIAEQQLSLEISTPAITAIDQEPSILPTISTRQKSVYDDDSPSLLDQLLSKTHTLPTKSMSVNELAPKSFAQLILESQKPHIRAKSQITPVIPRVLAPLPHTPIPPTPKYVKTETPPKETFEIEPEKKKMALEAWALLELVADVVENPIESAVMKGSNTTKGSFFMKDFTLTWNSKEEILDRIAERSWFPGMGRMEANISNILQIIMKVMNNGPWRDKMEAAKAALYLYHTFQTDLPNAVPDIIIPQLELLHDNQWQVRAQIATNLGAYKINHPEITLALMSKLNDENGMVRKAALNSLAVFGISSKESLRNAMVDLALLKIDSKQVSKYDWLDELIYRLRKSLEETKLKLKAEILLWKDGGRTL